MASYSPPVFIYASSAISHSCVDKLSIQLSNFEVDPTRIVRIDDISYLGREMLKTQQGVLIVPGAKKTLSVARELCTVDMKSRIQNAVNRGWSYLGSCAGANISAQDMTINSVVSNGMRLSSIGVPFLGLLHIHATAPAYLFETLGEKNGRTISVKTSDGKSFQTYWNEGSSFKILDGSVKGEAFYTDIDSNPAAAITGHYGKGTVVALGIHPEFEVEASPEETGKRKNFLGKIFESLQIIRGEER